MAGPRKVLREGGRLEALDQRGEAGQVRAVQRLFAAQAQRDAVQRQRIARADALQVVREGPASPR